MEKQLKFFELIEDVALVEFDVTEHEVLDRLYYPSLSKIEQFKEYWNKNYKQQISTAAARTIQEGIVMHYAIRARKNAEKEILTKKTIKNDTTKSV